MASIVFDRVTKAFGGTNAVNDLSLEIEDGEFLVLVGPSGCGKSTALRLLAGLERLTTGDIYIGDRKVTNVAAKDRDLAMVFQSYALYPHMTVRDNIAFGLKLHGVAKEESARRVTNTAGLLGIDDFLTRKPGQLSGGQRQRVALARAIVREPAAFLLDEPLSNLDAKLRVQTRAELTKLHERLGATFVYVTHDQVEAMTMATRIAVLDRGVLQQVGTPQELYGSPANLFVAGFIGSPAMNLLDASVARPDGVTVIDAGPIKLASSDRLTARLRDLPDRRVILGIRPEHIHDPDYLPPGIDPLRINVTVDVVESLGSETYLHLTSGDTSFIARVDPRSAATPGEPFQVAIDQDRLYAFNAETGLAI
ncbi:MAG TPA: sn-glycerol-3-phosphate ABC transporter ATP-binding protein UgpC [Dehalococcoidia bacterium]|jgi:multiple sugar transport system ATP-binding protein|nr:sn-glycerol-3-phosphate ABC transporter ATP-binding protein UgpC [Dehalococcoidia bacterium]